MTLEQEARHLRDLIYGPQKTKNWNRCKREWINDIQWLRETAATLKHEKK